MLDRGTSERLRALWSIITTTTSDGVWADDELLNRAAVRASRSGLPAEVCRGRCLLGLPAESGQ